MQTNRLSPDIVLAPHVLVDFDALKLCVFSDSDVRFLDNDWFAIISPGEVFLFSDSDLDGTFSLLVLSTRGTIMRRSLVGDRLTASPQWVPMVK